MDKLVVLETERAALVVSNSSLSRDMAEIKRALASCAFSASADVEAMSYCVFCVDVACGTMTDLKTSTDDDVPTLLTALSSVVADNRESP